MELPTADCILPTECLSRRNKVKTERLNEWMNKKITNCPQPTSKRLTNDCLEWMDVFFPGCGGIE